MRFSLLSLLVFTAVAALLCCLYLVVPGKIAGIAIMFLGLMLPAALISGIVYGRGYGRAFAIGGITSCSWMPVYLFYVPMTLIEQSFFNLFEEAENVVGFKIAFAAQIGLTFFTGLTAAGIRWLCVRGATSRPIALGNGAPQTMHIDPQDKAELYAILEGQLAGGTNVANDRQSPRR